MLVGPTGNCPQVKMALAPCSFWGVRKKGAKPGCSTTPEVYCTPSSLLNTPMNQVLGLFIQYYPCDNPHLTRSRSRQGPLTSQLD